MLREIKLLEWLQMLLHASFNQGYLFKTKNTFWIVIACEILLFFIKKTNFVLESYNFWKYVALHLPKNSQIVVSVQSQTELQAKSVTEHVDQELHNQAPASLQEVYYFNCMCNHNEKQTCRKFGLNTICRFLIQMFLKCSQRQYIVKGFWRTTEVLTALSTSLRYNLITVLLR